MFTPDDDVRGERRLVTDRSEGNSDRCIGPGQPGPFRPRAEDPPSAGMFVNPGPDAPVGRHWGAPQVFIARDLGHKPEL